MSHGIVARYPVMRTPLWRWSCRKLLRGKCEGRLCATLSPDICIEAQRSYDECTKTRFTVDLSGARSRRWKGEFLSIPLFAPCPMSSDSSSAHPCAPRTFLLGSAIQHRQRTRSYPPKRRPAVLQPPSEWAHGLPESLGVLTFDLRSRARFQPEKLPKACLRGNFMVPPESKNL